jgi:hypothetical protein
MRLIPLFLSVVFAQSLFFPAYVYALTTGPHQPEYTSYEEPGTSDMVNLLTGDFTFSLPILEVPGPEGSFSLPLSYHGGIALDQEASWVGLGFTLNAGNILRSVNQYPDDAAGEMQTITVQDLTGLYGFQATNGMFTTGWNNQTGGYGSMNLYDLVTASWGENQSTSVGVAGVSVSDGQIDFDPVQFVSAVATVLSWGTGPLADFGTAVLVSKEVSMDIANATTSSGGASFSSGGTATAAGAGDWQYNMKTKRIGLLGKVYKIWLDKTRNEKMYGSLYLGKGNMPDLNQTSFPWMTIRLRNGGLLQGLSEFPRGTGSINEGSASDINYDHGSVYSTTNNPASLALDDYSVRAPGVSGSIKPYRVDVGSVSMPRQMTKSHIRLAPVKYLDYKVPFIYEGMAANSHFYNTGGVSAPAAPGFYSGIDMQVAYADPYQNHLLTYELNDIAFQTPRLKPGLDPASPKLAQANHIEWLSNEDIINYPYPSKFIDFLTASDRSTFRSNFTLASSAVTSTTTSSSDNFSTTIQLTPSVIGSFHKDMAVTLDIQFYDDAASREEAIGGSYTAFNVTVQSVDNDNNRIIVSSDPGMDAFYGKYADIAVRYSASPQIQKAIGGYCITGMDGVTYHFALPSYDYDWKTEIIDVNNSSKKSIIKRSSPFANTWLLTAITGPDFIDRNDNGIADDGDWGYWVKLNYGNHTDDYKWRLPYADYKRSSDNLYNTYTEGFKQIYYLNSIETRSHVALFLKSTRADNQSLNLRTALELDEICLMTKENYQKLVMNYGIPQFSNKISQMCLSSAFDAGSGARNYVNLNSLKRIVFAYNYDLCPNTPNSVVSTVNPTQGKLTLERVAIFGRNSIKTVPDYRFEYDLDPSSNPSYDANKWDGWDYYNPDGTGSVASHRTPSTAAGDGTAWSLKKIITPLGSEIIVNQERDTYSTISGQPMYSGEYSYGYYYTDPAAESDVANNRIRSTANAAPGDKVVISGSSIEYKCSPSSSFEVKSYDGEFTVDHSDGSYIYFSGANYAGLACPTPYDVQQNYGTFKVTFAFKKGANLRVASIVNRDGFGGENKIQYLYSDASGNTTGVVAKEPDYIKDQLNNFDDLPGYPFTPVLYTKVTVLTGKLSTLADYHTKYVYEFEPPSPSMLTVQKVTIKPRTEIFRDPVGYVEYAETYQHNITDRTAKIGRLNKISVFRKGDISPVAQTDMVYASQILNNGVDNYQGVYSESVLMFDRVVEITASGCTINLTGRQPFVTPTRSRRSLQQETDSALKSEILVGTLLQVTCWRKFKHLPRGFQRRR